MMTEIECKAKMAWMKLIKTYPEAHELNELEIINICTEEELEAMKETNLVKSSKWNYEFVGEAKVPLYILKRARLFDYGGDLF